jgi:hypothetical protein
VKPFLHAVAAAKRWGGAPEDYLPVEDFLDSSKAHHADMRHRALLHHSFGIYLAELVFGHHVANADGVLVSVRDVGEQHVLEDCGRIPSAGDYLESLPLLDWLGGPARRRGTDALREPHPRVGKAQLPATFEKAKTRVESQASMVRRLLGEGYRKIQAD